MKAPVRPVDPQAPPPGSIAAAYRERFGSAVQKADNDRLAGVSLIADKLRVRRDGLPRLLIYSTCRNLIRTLPALPRDPRHPEDVDTKSEDHAYDALRYLAMRLAGRRTPSGAASPLPDPPNVETVTGRIARAGF